jgi:hypothetical protein
MSDALRGQSLLLRSGDRVSARRQGRAAVTPAALLAPLFLLGPAPFLPVGLDLHPRGVELRAGRHARELGEQGARKRRDDPLGWRTRDCGARRLAVVDRSRPVLFMPVRTPTLRRAASGQEPGEGELGVGKEGPHLRMEQLGSGSRRLRAGQVGNGPRTRGSAEGRLRAPADALPRADGAWRWGPPIAGAFTRNFPAGSLLPLRRLSRRPLGWGEEVTLRRPLGSQGA